MLLTPSGREQHHPVMVEQGKPAMGVGQHVSHAPWLAEICQ